MTRYFLFLLVSVLVTITPWGSIFAGSPNTLALSIEDGYMNSLSKGITYRLLIEPTNGSSFLQPLTGDEEGVALRFVLHTDPGSNVVMQFVFPSVLFGDCGSRVPCSFPSNGLLRMASHELMNRVHAGRRRL